MTKKTISPEKLLKYKNELSKDSSFCLARNAVARVDLHEVAMNWDQFAQVDHVFSNSVKPELKATSQFQSGRCWIFAALNLMRIPFCRKLKIEEFEFSQSYLFFYDKLEKANYFLENILATTDESHDSRIISYLVSSPLSDGGQWDMLVNIINKYGLVPKSVYPDSKASLESKFVNHILTLKLREWAQTLRALKKEQAATKVLEDTKASMMEEAYRIMATHFGFPPETFSWSYMDKNKKFHTHQDLTPKIFFEKYVDFPLDEMFCLVHSPRKSTPLNQTYTVQYLGNVVEGRDVCYLNVEIEEMKKAAVASIMDNTPVWFGCDVGKYFHRTVGVMDTDFYQYNYIYNTEFTLDKAGRMNYGESQMTHAMLFTAVHIENGKPTKWRVENSWGKDVGDKGYFIMTDKWFDEFMFEIAIHKKYLSKETIEAFKKPPTVLPPWDPLGALA